jgi:tetratricopeptide (TPR) repeat protein
MGRIDKTVFVSYRRSDASWAPAVVGNLTQHGYDVFIDYEAIGPGRFATVILENIRRRAHFVVLLTPTALERCGDPDDWMRREIEEAIDSKRNIVPLMLGGFTFGTPAVAAALTGKLAHLKEYNGLKIDPMYFDSAMERLRDQFLNVSPETVPHPASPLLASNIPIRVPEHFLGRDDALAAIATALARHEGRVAITALHGMRGVGKTTLAAAYAERHRGDYRATWWIRAQTDIAMRADLIALGIRLGWVGADAKEESALAEVKQKLSDEGEGILLIYDNAIDAIAIRPYLPPRGAARVLVTSNAHAWRGMAAPLEIRLWPKDIGGEYLIARTGRKDERVAAESLSEALGGLPLAHEQAAAYCEDLGIGFAEYRRRFEAATVAFLDDKEYAPADYHPERVTEHQDRLTVAGTFRLAIEEAARRHPAAEPLIVHAALLAPEPIPLFLLAEARETFGEPLASALAGDGLDRTVAALRAFALADREAIAYDRDVSNTIDAIRLHRLVREVAAARCSEKARQAVQRALLAALAAVYPRDGYANPDSWPQCAALSPHLLAACEAEFPNTEPTRGDLLDRAGAYFHGRAAYLTARPLFERALAISEKVLGPEHPDTARSLNSLALLLRDEGDLAEARPLHERALAIYEKVRGPENPATATSLNNLDERFRSSNHIRRLGRACRSRCGRRAAD